MRTAILPAILALAALTAYPALGQKNKKATPAAPDAPAATPEKANPGEDAESTQDFVIGAEDVLSISVYDQPQFTVINQSVRPDGIISMPLVGEVKAMGKTPRDLEAEIAKILADKYLRTTPRVMITVNTVKSRYFMIEGGVNKPGQVRSAGPHHDLAGPGQCRRFPRVREHQKDQPVARRQGHRGVQFQ